MSTSSKEIVGEEGALLASPTNLGISGKHDLLMRFFESDFFDAWIAVTYLHKTLAEPVHDYLCSRLSTLPEGDVERYLSQLCQLCVSRPGTALEPVLIGLCAQSLRVAVKTYWLLLAISQDNPKNEHVARLRDQCEQAGLEGHWDLPFKDTHLPSPVYNTSGILSRFRRASTATLSAQQTPPLQNGTGISSAFTAVAGSSSSPIGVITPPASGQSGITVGHIPFGASPDPVPRITQWRSGALSPDVPSRPLSPDGLGHGIHSSVFMDTGVEGLIYESNLPDARDDDELASDITTPSEFGSNADLANLQNRTSRWWRQELPSSSGRSGGDDADSQPNSPLRRETTFGSTLDFVEALCTASSNLTVFQSEDRQWALQKALHSINAEMDRASGRGVAIWWPMGRSLRQRVVRLAYKESRLLNSREKAPFTLFVEVLNEAAAEAEAEAAEAARLSAAAQIQKLPPPRQEMEFDPAAAAAAAEGIPWVPHHHRRSSSIDTSASLLLAVAAVQSSSAAGTAANRTPLTPAAAWEAAAGPLFASPSLTATSGAIGGGSIAEHKAPSLVSQRSEASTFATDLSLADFASEASHSPPGKRPLSGSASGGLGDDGGDVSAAAAATASSLVRHSPSAPPLPPLPRGVNIQGAGHWIGGSNVRLHPVSTADMGSELNAALAALRGEAPLVHVHLQVLDDTPLEASLPLSEISRTNSGIGSSSAASSDSTATAEASVPTPAVGGSGARRGAVHPAPSATFASEPPQTCAKNGWLCKFGLCKTCNALAKASSSQPSTPPSAKSLRASAASSKQQETQDASSLSKTAPVEALAAVPVPVKAPRVKVSLTVQGGLNLSIRRTQARHQRMPSHEALLHVANEHKLPVPPPAAHLPSTPEAASEAASCGPSPPSTNEEKAPKEEQPRHEEHVIPVHGEKWSALKARLRADSPHGNRPGWDVRSVIVKSGDDCRQELLAMQLISTFHEVFAEAQLPLWLRPFEVLVTSNRTALIEMVPNAPSIHAIKAKRPPGTSLRDHFIAEFGEGTPALKRAQRNFVESLAAYSLVCYLLQIKDRHNGNILLDDSGHVIHIDFGFMLSNSPGGVNFESAPFKLTRELLEVMDSDPEGRPSELFDYYKVLLIQGFLAVRRHSDRITLLVEMMSSSGCPCFKNKVAAVHGVKKRLALGVAEHTVVEVVLGLISDSLDAWRTRQYDYYQRVLNGIL